MNLLGPLLPDFSARVCGRSICARLFSCQGRVDFSLVSGLRRTRPPPQRWNTPSFIFDLAGILGRPRVAARRLVLAAGHRTDRALRSSGGTGGL